MKHPGWNIECQHGLIECTGNMFQACFLSIPGVSRDDQIEVVNCINGNGAAYDAGRANDAALRVCVLDIHLSC